MNIDETRVLELVGGKHKKTRIFLQTLINDCSGFSYQVSGFIDTFVALLSHEAKSKILLHQHHLMTR